MNTDQKNQIAAEAAKEQFEALELNLLLQDPFDEELLIRLLTKPINAAIEKATEDLQHDCKRLAETLVEITKSRAAHASDEKLRPTTQCENETRFP